MNQSTVLANAVAGKATAHGLAEIITSEALTTAAGATYTLTLSNNQIFAESVVMASISNGSNSQGDPCLGLVTVSQGQAVVTVVNRHATQAFNGTLQIAILVRQ